MHGICDYSPEYQWGKIYGKQDGEKIHHQTTTGHKAHSFKAIGFLKELSWEQWNRKLLVWAVISQTNSFSIDFVCVFQEASKHIML